jgi:hypothetical protein
MSTPVPKVLSAIHAVLAALSKDGIAKDQRNTQQNFNFRGIDTVLNVLSGLLDVNKLLIIPTVLERIQTERETNKGGVLFSVVCKIEYKFYSVEDGSSVTAILYGEAMDSGDKATNKALSAAYKYMAIQSFAIPTEGIEQNDADATTPPEVKSRGQEKRDANSRAEPGDERPPVMRGGPTESARSSAQSQNESKGPQEGKAKHPILLQLEAALNKYGDGRPKAEARLAEKFEVASIDKIPGAILPQALLVVMNHQKEMRNAAAAKKAADKPAGGKKPAGKKPKDEPQPPDDGDVPEGASDDSDDGDLPV